MDLSHWNLVDVFTMHEAACLAAGVEPRLDNGQTEVQFQNVKFIELQMLQAYRQAEFNASLDVQNGACSPGITEESVFKRALPSSWLSAVVKQCICGDKAFDIVNFKEESPAKFTRRHLHAWFESEMFHPAYKFLLRPLAIESEKQAAMSDEKPLTKSDRNNLLKQIAALSLALAEKSGKYKLGNKPNASQIADATRLILDALPDVNTNGVGKSNIRESIKLGLELLAAPKK